MLVPHIACAHAGYLLRYSLRVDRAGETNCAVLIRDTGKFFYRLAMAPIPILVTFI
jgi:hypothetical protein